MAHDTILDARALHVLLGLVHELRKLGDWDTVQWPSEDEDQIHKGRDKVKKDSVKAPLMGSHLPYVRWPGLYPFASICQGGIEPVLPVRPYRLGFRLRLCGPEVVTAVFLDDLLDHLNGL